MAKKVHGVIDACAEPRANTVFTDELGIIEACVIWRFSNDGVARRGDSDFKE